VHRCGLGSVERRDFLALLTGGLVAALTGCSSGSGRTKATRSNGSGQGPGAGTLVPTTGTTLPPPPLPRIPGPRPGRPRVISRALNPTRQVALTIDDGYCRECIAGYVAFAQRTGIHLTFSPNGRFGELWRPHTAVLRPLIANGQVQFGNHTWSHPDLLRANDATVRTEIQRNEDWIEKSFGITARPYFRPPYGRHDRRIDDIAGSLGFTSILMWSGTLGDATVESPQALLGLADKWVKAGTIVLGHANHPTVLGLFDQLQGLLAQRGLQPVTVDAMFGTSRAHG